MGSSHPLQIGILGGTFNPIHLGHLLIAQDALEQADLDCVRFVPCARPPHHKPGRLAPAEHRLRMVRLAVRGNPRFVADDLEIRRGGVSYSVDTLTELRRRQPQAVFHFIIGADGLAELHLWKDLARLAGLCRFVIAPRPGFEVSTRRHWRVPPALARRLRVRAIQGRVCDIASREIRARLARGLSIRYLVPEPVFRYSEAHKLYR